MNAKQNRGWMIASIIACVIVTIKLFLLAILTAITRPKVGPLYHDLNIPVPPLTQSFLEIPTVIYLTFWVALIVGLIVKECMVRRKKTTFIINMIGFAASVVCWILFFLMIAMPMITLVESIGKTE